MYIHNFLKTKIRTFLSKEDGQSTVMVVLSLVVILGTAALALDLGAVHSAQIRMQNAADLAAIAGAKNLTDTVSAKAAASEYAEMNGVSKEGITVNTPYNNNPYAIEVICSENIGFGFAKILGFNDGTARGRAVASFKSIWAGEALPFINNSKSIEVGEGLTLWDKTGPGDFGRIDKTDYEWYAVPATEDNPEGYYCFVIDYSDGITYQKGVDASIKKVIEDMYNKSSSDQRFYAFSVSPEYLESGEYEDLKNKDVIPPEALVLLECSFDDYRNKTMQLTVTGIYDINNGEYPTDFLYSSTSGTAALIE